MFTKTRTLLALGLLNVARVASYRLRLRAGVHPVRKLPIATPPRGPFFAPPTVRCELSSPPTGLVYFGWREEQGDGPPDWHSSPFTKSRPRTTTLPWWQVPDFDAETGDIKAIWEASRFDWVVHFAQQAVADGETGAVDVLNSWLSDWSEKNRPYLGHNWKCGQEASIRVMHLAVASLVMKQTANPLPSLIELLTIHLERIAPTVAYAIGQQNNHGTSEAAALVIGGSWLRRQGISKGAVYERLGRELLENSAAHLIERDGSFSQYSVNYHRLMLDTLSLVEVWRRAMDLERFADGVYAKASLACDWLRAMTDPSSGDAPNIGANDGANLLPLCDAGHRDFRPAVQLASAVFQRKCAYTGAGKWVAHLRWLGVESPADPAPVQAWQLFDDGGYAVVRLGSALAVLRYPRFHFRPSHADALHIDLWVSGDNVLRDGGTFSYSADSGLQEYFTGARGHNGVQFDDREQMPRLGRFLWGDWLETSRIDPLRAEPDGAAVSAAYKDRYGATHSRRVNLRGGSLVVVDAIQGFDRRAVLRWRLRPGAWRIAGGEVTDGAHRLLIAADAAIARFEIVEGWESRYYLRKSAIPVVEVEVTSPCTITSEYRWVQ